MAEQGDGRATDARLKRRREQNRQAQRRFRERQNSKTVELLPLAPELDLTALSTTIDDADATYSGEPTLQSLVFDHAVTSGYSPSSSSSPNLVPVTSSLGSRVSLLDQDLQQYAASSHVNSAIEFATLSATDVNIGITPSHPPLHMAVRNGSESIVLLLLQHGADCNAKDAQGLTPLIHATIEGQYGIAKLLLSYGACVPPTDHQHRSALHWAVLHDRDRMLSLLLKNCRCEHNVLNAYDLDGRTPLHIAISNSMASAVEILLKAGADVECMPRNML